MKSVIVQASIGPIHAADIRLPPPGVPLFDADRLVDQKHPITKTLMEQLPRLSDDELTAVRKHLEAYNGRVNAMSSLSDVESWIAMVDLEVTFRQQAQKKSVVALLEFLTGTKFPQG